MKIPQITNRERETISHHFVHVSDASLHPCVYFDYLKVTTAKTCCSLQSSDREGQMQLLVVFVILNLILQQSSNFCMLCNILLSRKNANEDQILTNGIILLLRVLIARTCDQNVCFSVCQQI